MEKISFVTLAVSPFWLDQTILLAESLRAFGGQLAQSTLSVLTPTALELLPTKLLDKLEELDSKIIEIEIPVQALEFPLGLIPFAAAQAEDLAAGKSSQLAWMLPDTIVVSPPDCFMLPEGKQLAYRPVHHANIGSDFNQPPDDYWSLILNHCKVPAANIFPMTTCTRDKVVRPYINAGILVTRPEQGFFQAWKECFEAAYQNKDFLPLLEEGRNALFLHQAILSGSMIKMFSRDQLYELPEAVNYPLHLHDEYRPDYKPASLNQLITFRYENLEELLIGLEKVIHDPTFSNWLQTRIAAGG